MKMDLEPVHHVSFFFVCCFLHRRDMQASKKLVIPLGYLYMILRGRLKGRQ